MSRRARVEHNEGDYQQKVRVRAEQAKRVKAVKKTSRRVASDDEEESQQTRVEHDSPSYLNGYDVDEDVNGVDDQGDEDEEDESPTRGHKRVRVNDQGDSVPSSPDKGKARERGCVRTLPRAADGYIPGSIVRIQLENFVTYDWVEFRPGPYLNMILGPNGTGKSSIACAICLGLNWPPSVLGRAAELNSFVKIGKPKGHIEIELKGPQGEPNIVIRRNISATSRSSTFMLNGNPSSGKEITIQMAKLNVQIGNLCSFLPQDKVSEFAQMTPQQLLRETQRAAGDERLTDWHNTLISSGKELKQLEEVMEGERDQLKTMQERNATLEKDVKRYQERRKIEEEIKTLEVLIPVNEYHEARVVYDQTKLRQRELHEHVRVLKEKNAPAHALLEQLGMQYKEFDKEREQKKTATRQRFQQMKANRGESEKIEADAEDLSVKLDNLKKGEKERVKIIKTLEAQRTKLQDELDNPPRTENIDEINAKIRLSNQDRNKTKMRLATLQDRQTVNVDESGKQRAKIDNAKNELAKLDDENHRRLQSLARWDKDCTDAVVWLRQNQAKFKMEVFEPPIICVNIPDKRYANAVEACFNANNLKTIVAQCPEDYNTLNHWLNDLNEVAKARINTWYRPRQEESLPPPPMDAEQMARLGFDGYAIDHVKCPEGLKWYLQKELNLHRTAIALNGSNVDVDGAMNVIASSPDGSGATFIAGNTLNAVSRSRYGKRMAQNTTRDIRQARNLVSSTINPEVKRGLEEALHEATVALEACISEGANLAVEERNIRAEDKEHLKELEALNARKKATQDVVTRQGTLSVKIEMITNKLNDLVNAPSINDERARLKKKLGNLSKKRIQLAKDYQQLMRAVISDLVEATRKGLEVSQISANRSALELLCQQSDEEYQKALADFDDADKIFNLAKADAKRKRDISLRLVKEMSQVFQDRFRKMEIDGTVYQRDSEQLRADLEIQRANLAMNTQTNSDVVEQYEKRKAEIEKLTKILEGRERNGTKLERAIKSARDQWEPALRHLIDSIGKKFSLAFDRIGCAGEIRISPQEDYDKWAIDILVKFRDSEKLQLLTGQRQSGGERSLTTILYLMSLTEEARTPFSLVDEINQGMDMRAERAVHNSMVEVTCKDDSAQYFLITPKLLADLHYHERMKILCVNNGEWLPDDHRGLGNMMSLVDNYVKYNANSVTKSIAAN